MAALAYLRRGGGSEVLNCGRYRVWMDPNRFEDIGDCVTREDIRGMIHDGGIQKKQKIGIFFFFYPFETPFF